MSESGIRAGKAYVEITTDQSKLLAGLRKAQERLNAFGSRMEEQGQSLLKVGAVALAPFALGLKKLAETDPQVAADMKDLANAINEVLVELGRVMYEGIKPFIGVIKGACKGLAEWIRNNKGLVDGLSWVITGVVALGVAMTALGAAAKATAAAMTLVNVLVAVFGSTIGLVIVGITAAVAAVLYFTGAFSAMAKGFSAAWTSIVDAIKGGQLALAVKIAMKGAHIALLEGARKLWDVVSKSDALKWLMYGSIFGSGSNYWDREFQRRIRVARRELAALQKQVKGGGALSAAQQAAQQLKVTSSTYASLNAKAFTNLFSRGGTYASQQSIPTQQLNTLKQINGSTSKIKKKIEDLEVG